ncbi:MAG TPA: OmpA family protein [Spirochaetota bacterium]|nr:OmpA family protein [Spirochaetota bacterium]HPY88824.1 OmpA family protein [Spirochaetota bacterium]HQB60970.1 OmpA family protein [Spirochaetota bacterium]
MRRRLFASIMIFAPLLTLNAVEIRYKFDPNTILYIETNSIVRRLYENEYIGDSIYKEVSYIKTENIESDKATLSINNYVMEDTKLNYKTKTYKTKTDTAYKYKKDVYGNNYQTETKKGLHSFPCFPENSIEIGSVWTKPSKYNIDLFNDNKSTLSLDLDVVYQLSSIETIDDEQILTISANAIFVHNKNRLTLLGSGIKKIIGFSSFLIKFNNTAGRPSIIEEIYDFTFILDDCELIETSGSSKSAYKVPPPIKIEETRNWENDEDFKDTEIKIIDGKLYIVMANIHFKPDSPEILHGEYSRVDKVARLIENYKFNQIIITGHTADIGQPKNQKILSEQRALTILNYLVEKHKFNASYITYGGKGGENPIADNSTPEGRAKNRRVEIIVLP